MYQTFGDLWTFWMGPFGAHFIPGVVIPMVVSIAGLVLCWKEIVLHRFGIMLCALANIPFVAWQGWHGWDGGGLHLLDLFPFVIVFAYRLQGIAMRPLVAFTGTWLSLIGADVIGGYIHAGTTYGIFEPLAWLGGDGWKDGLLIYPLCTAIFALLVPPVYGWILRRDPAYQRLLFAKGRRTL